MHDIEENIFFHNLNLIRPKFTVLIPFNKIIEVRTLILAIIYKIKKLNQSPNLQNTLKFKSQTLLIQSIL